MESRHVVSTDQSSHNTGVSHTGRVKDQHEHYRGRHIQSSRLHDILKKKSDLKVCLWPSFLVQKTGACFDAGLRGAGGMRRGRKEAHLARVLSVFHLSIFFGHKKICNLKPNTDTIMSGWMSD